MERELIPIVVTLQWDGRGAPCVTASGRGDLAARIVELAAAHGVPLHEDPMLVEVLSHIEIGREIPPVLFRAIAEIIAFAYSLRRHGVETSPSLTI
jgi:flagellar biosynthesis protein